MTRMIRQSMTADAAPLCETIVETPEPRGSEVLVRISRCGVCHSDIHLHDGYFSLGGDNKLDVTAGRALPFTLGHEIAGVEKAIPTPKSRPAGRSRVPDRLRAMRRPAGRARRICVWRRAASASRWTAVCHHVPVPHPPLMTTGLPAACGRLQFRG